MLWSMTRLRGYGLHARDGGIGHVVSVLFDDEHWTVRYLVVDTGGWLGRRVLIPAKALGRPDADSREIAVELTRTQIEHSPDVDAEKTVDRQQEGALYGYYGWEPYWGSPAIGGGPSLGAAAEHGAEDIRPGRAPGDPHLRSARDVAGYRVHCDDRSVGHVDDFLLDDDGWQIRYVVIDTGSWLPGRKVPLPPDWVHAISWEDREIRVGLRAEQIESSPSLDDEQSIDREFEDRLYRHYGRPSYWSG